jgi:galactokinase
MRSALTKHSGELSLIKLADEAAGRFRERFTRAPQWIAAAPGRVNLIGEHTDYNDGFVLPMAIERWTVIAAAPAEERRISICSTSINESAVAGLDRPVGRAEQAWANYVFGVVSGFQELGAELPGLDAVVHSNVPIGGGLSSSAALEVATATLLEAVTGRTLEPVAKALLCQRAEHEFAGVPCGIMDQFTSVLARQGHVLLLDCRTRSPELVPMSHPGIAVLIINTNVKHELAGSEYAIRRAQCEQAARILQVAALRDCSIDTLLAAGNQIDPVLFRRAMHVITENDRTIAAARALRDSNWPQMGELMYASHDSLRDDYEVSCPELDMVVDFARSLGPREGVIGCRMTGGGFGGCAVSLVQADALETIEPRITEAYHHRTGLSCSIFVSRPAAGARLLSDNTAAR